MKGLNKNINWAEFTKQNRILDNETKYSEFGEPWQFEIDKAIDENQRVYLQLARGHDKTDRYAWWSLLWLSTTIACRGYAVGVDADNAALFRDSSKKLCALHPDLFRDIEVQKKIVMNKSTGSYIETISSDVDSAYGLNFDLLIVNDFHAWPDKAFWDVLWTACFKKPGIRVWVESNALTYGEEDVQWKYEFRKWVQHEGVNISESEGKWYFFAPPKFLAGWESSGLKQWQQTLHPAQYQRLINNIDTTGECAFVTEEQVQAITLLPGPYDGLKEQEKQNGFVVTGVDLGLKKDATCIATVKSVPVQKGQPPKFILLAMDVLTGSIGDPVMLREVESVMLLHREKYKSNPILCDPWNAASLIQKYPGFMVEWTFTTAHVRELTQLLFRAINDRQLTLYKDAGKAIQAREEWTLQRELVQAVVKEMSYGQRIDHQSGGFSDRVMALGMALHFLASEQNIPRLKTPPSEPISNHSFSGNKIINDWNDQTAENKNLLRIK